MWPRMHLAFVQGDDELRKKKALKYLLYFPLQMLICFYSLFMHKNAFNLLLNRFR